MPTCSSLLGPVVIPGASAPSTFSPTIPENSSSAICFGWEILPKALYHQRFEEAAFYRAVFARAQRQRVDPAVTDQARLLAERHGLAAMDALHLAVALQADADAFVSGERPDKPMFRVTELPVVSLWSPRP